MGLSEQAAKKMLGDKYPRVISRPDQAARPKPAAESTASAQGMNKTETAYSRRLESRRLAGEILSWRFEALTFRLAHRCNYTPDFLVITPAEIQVHEVKGGFVREDGLIKWKMAAERHPEFRFFLCRFIRGQWRIEEYSGRSGNGHG